MARYSKKPQANAKKKKYKRACSTARRARDIDQIHDDLERGGIKFEFDEDLPGGGQFYCVYCARHFISKPVLEEHTRTKAHKRRRKELIMEAKYTQDEAEMGAGKTKEDLPPAHPDLEQEREEEERKAEEEEEEKKTMAET